ncbi:MAG: DUF4126 domain-containing protein [Caldilineaceae bacterium]|nr:DUF4126 domain-containing protein [Caldilineaceae bacterium]
MEIALSIALGIGLSAACGFRIFVPFLVMSVAALSGNLELSSGFEWIGSYPALLALAIATALEIAAYYVPWMDNTLDAIATPAAIVAGTIATASVVTDMSPFLTWTLAVIAGGGIAGVIQSGTVLLRATSSATTMGVGNFAVASSELAGSVSASIAAFVMPVATVFLVGVLLVLCVRGLTKALRKVREASA